MAPRATVADPHVVAPAPWKLKGKAWVLLYRAPNGVLPSDAYPAHERGTPYADEAVNGPFKNILGSIFIVRYTETDVGPYDEIIFNPGAFEDPVTKSKHPRITTIYVSTEASVRNGRRNWGIPKSIANFTFTTDPSSKFTDVSVNLPGEEIPFFRCTLTPARFVPSIPLSKYIPMPTLVQPPIPPPTSDSSMLVACPNWMSVTPVLGGWSRLVWAKGGLEGGKYGDGEAFADCQPMSWALEITSFEGDFPVGKVLGESKKTS
jgi:hypothetical protein